MLTMQDLESVFNSTIEQYIQPQGQIVLALSGGLDSRVMLALLKKYCENTGSKAIAVHVHHGLSIHADDWAKQCQKWCLESGLECFVEHVSLELKGKSLEESARDARYAALSKHLNENDVLLTGQHADDQLETFLLALRRGSGPRGLSCMPQVAPMGKAQLIRPLLHVKRHDIELYAKDSNLEWLNDESNQDKRFERNYIRHTIVPSLSKRWPHIQQSVQRSSELCAEQEALIEELISEKYRQCLRQDKSLSISKLIGHSENVRRSIIRMWLSNESVKMPTRSQLEIIWQQVAMAQQDANPKLQLANIEIRRFLEALYIVRDFQSLANWNKDIHFEQPCLLPDNLGTLVLISTGNGRLSKQSLNTAPLTVIFEPEGLVAHPTDRAHRRKLKKLFQEYAVPSWMRRRTPILMCGDKVAAVGELFVDRAFSGDDCDFVWQRY